MFVQGHSYDSLSKNHASDSIIPDKTIENKQPINMECLDFNKTKKNRNSIITGSADEQNSFVAAEKKAWLYVGRANSDTRPEHVRTYLETKFPTHKNSFTVQTITNINNDRPVNNISFKVGVNFTLLDEITKSDVWPKKYHRKTIQFQKQ